ncbi:homoserine dehydrogenase [Thermogladius calderae 1633]|uniref:homoserine dehydrogenase n=1 Tax=Thermogladius calderae (strain DSM 22663 / VKM B-2946 / 1633) TaxID=1184251 RepID=I3TEL8_THEC1|nr:homoserine dehydrogenase [Thermogladius calderae]AFK51206.1 homoserine dehydrogenase [Thermogladius calderae 1633]
MAEQRVVIVGFGNVGRGLVKTLLFKSSKLAKHGVNIVVVGVVDSKGMVYKPEGLRPVELLKMLETPRSGLRSLEVAKQYVDLKELYEKTKPDIHVELTPANYETGEPGLSNIRFALNEGAHVATANKSPLVFDFKGLTELARSRGLVLKYTATVMGASSFLSLLDHMKLQDVYSVRGILNTTSNIVLSLAHEKLVEVERAVEEAIVLGIAERDPSIDIDGYDAAAKLTIISNVIGKPVDFKSIERVSLRGLSLREVVMAIKEGKAWKQVSSIDYRSQKARVALEKVEPGDLLYHVRGAMNGVVIETDTGSYFFMGKGGGGVETAHTVANDILAIALREV